MAGRPRKRSVDESLQIALRLFWKMGYESTSIQDLSEALGVGPSSVYNTFESKEALYRRCLERYIEEHGAFIRDALALEDAVDALLRILEQAPAQYRQEGCPAGCAVISADRLPGQDVDQHLIALRKQTLSLLQQRIERGIDDQQLLAETDAEALARFLFATLQGLSSQAQDGATLEQLQRTAQQAHLPVLAARSKQAR